jgi:hypothetical protein
MVVWMPFVLSLCLGKSAKPTDVRP